MSRSSSTRLRAMAGKNAAYGIGGASGAAITSRRIQKAFFVIMSTGFLSCFTSSANLHARMLCQTDPFGIHSRDGAVSLQPHSQRFRQGSSWNWLYTAT